MSSRQVLIIKVVSYFILLIGCTKQPGGGPMGRENALKKKSSHKGAVPDEACNIHGGKYKEKPVKYFGPSGPDFIPFCEVNNIETYCDWLESLEGDIDHCQEPEKRQNSPDALPDYYCKKEWIEYFVELNRGRWVHNIHPMSRESYEHFYFKVCCTPGAIPPFSRLPIEERKLVKCYNDPEKFSPWVMTLCSNAGDNFTKDFDMPKLAEKGSIKKLCCVRSGNGICISTDCDLYVMLDAYLKSKGTLEEIIGELCAQPMIIKKGSEEEFVCGGNIGESSYDKYELQLCLVNEVDTAKNKMWKLENFDLICKEKEKLYACQLITKENVKVPLEYEHISSTTCDEKYEFVTCCEGGYFPTHMLPLEATEINKDYDPKTFLPWIVKKHVRSKEP